MALTGCQQVDMFGCTLDELKQEWETGRRMCPSREMYAMSILSDAQECLRMDDAETARRYINKAKWHLSEMMDEARARAT